MAQNEDETKTKFIRVWVVAILWSDCITLIFQGIGWCSSADSIQIDLMMWNVGKGCAIQHFIQLNKLIPRVICGVRKLEQTLTLFMAFEGNYYFVQMKQFLRVFLLPQCVFHEVGLCMPRRNWSACSNEGSHYLWRSFRDPFKSTN